jgi:hypothetical protein
MRSGTPQPRPARLSISGIDPLKASPTSPEWPAANGEFQFTLCAVC